MCFQHIAHTSIHGFHEEWFSTPGAQVHFLKHTLRFPCHGDQDFTYSDVEKAIQAELRRRHYLEIYALRLAEQQRIGELKVLARLERKYRQPAAPLGQEASFIEARQSPPTAEHQAPGGFPSPASPLLTDLTEFWTSATTIRHRGRHSTNP